MIEHKRFSGIPAKPIDIFIRRNLHKRFIYKYINCVYAVFVCVFFQVCCDFFPASDKSKALEHDLGVKLLVRENRSFHLTKAGEYLYMIIAFAIWSIAAVFEIAGLPFLFLEQNSPYFSSSIKNPFSLNSFLIILNTFSEGAAMV